MSVKANLCIGSVDGGKGNFYLPNDLVARTLAIIGQRGAGKTSLATVIAEEMCKAALPWIALDPVGVWWGLRTGADGSTASGHPVQEKTAGAADRSVYEPWLQKAGRKGCRRMLEILVERGQLTRNQLGTLAGIPNGKRTFRAYLSWLKTNGLVEVIGEDIKLRAV